MDYPFKQCSHSIPLYSDLMRRAHPSATDMAMLGVMSGSSLSVSGGELTGIDHCLRQRRGLRRPETAGSFADTISRGACTCTDVMNIELP